MRQIKPHGIIHLFALLHVAATVLCRIFGYDDELLLTLLTMCMLLLICMRLDLKIEFSAAIIIIVNAIGYFFGVGGAKLIGLVCHSEIVVHALSTALTTEIIGWSTLWLGALMKKFRGGTPSSGWSPRIIHMLVIVLCIFLIRLGLVAFNTYSASGSRGFYDITMTVLSNVPVMVMMTCINLIFIRLARRHVGPFTRARLTVVGITVLMMALLASFMIVWGVPFGRPCPVSGTELVRLLIVEVLFEAVSCCILFVIDFAMSSRRAFKAETLKRHKAQFEYLRLKQQVNPHFLFNSLNVLDCLVAESKNKQAGEFIHKLSGMYRYMLSNEDMRLLPVREEMQFVRMYVDLMKVRFPEGFEFCCSITEEANSRFAVPCSIQMLVENAFKHNSVSPESPLVIKITADGGSLTVANNLRPRLSSDSSSTKVGLNYIRQQYFDLSGKMIEQACDGREFIVKIPLL